MSAQKFKAILFLIALCGAAYWRVSQCDFVGYDDPDYVTRNPHVLAGLTKESVKWAFCINCGVATYFHPVTWLSHMLDVQLFGLRPAAHHLVNLLFHTLNSVLLFLVFQRMTGAFWRSLVLASLWAVHPLQVDTVAWVTERKNVLSGLFWIMTMAAYVRYTAKPSLGRYLLALTAMAVGLLCKPTLVTLPCVLLLLDYWPLRRSQFSPSLQFAKTGPQPSDPPSFPAASLLLIIIEKVPFLFLSALSALSTIFDHRRLQVMVPDAFLSFGQRFWNAWVSYMRYLDKTLWPSDLAVFYPHPGSWPTWQVASALLVLALITVVALLLIRRAPYLIVGWLWFLGVLVPTIGFIQAGSQAMADRFAYVPLIGVFLMVTWGGFDLLERLQLKPPASLVPWFAVVLVLAFVASLQVRHWRNNQTLFAQALRATDRNYIALATAGNDLVEAGRYDEALQYLVQAQQINPGYQMIYTLLGNLYAKLGRFQDAEPMFKQAITMSPTYVEGYVAFGNALIQQQRLDEATTNLLKAIELDRGFAEAWNGLGTVQVRQGRAQEGLASFDEAIRLRPGFSEAMQNRGVALFNLGRTPEAAAAFEAVLKLKPEAAGVLLQLGNTRLAQGQFSEALATFRRVLEVDPQSLDALNRVAWMLATQNDPQLRNGTEAVRLAQRAVEIAGPENPAVLNVLAAAFAEIGQFDNAIATAGKALALASASNQAGLADIIEKLLELYRQGRPYREAGR